MQERIELGIENLTDVEQIGRGGFSIVYAATNTLLGTRVAVKVLGRLTAESDRKRFERECQVMGRLSRHPNVVTVHHAGYADGTDPYLVMELVEGGSLADRLEQQGPVPWPEAVDLVVPIAEALAYVHDAGILHRDVKPENILIGAGGEPLLTDFGIARLGDGGGTNTGTGIAASWLHAPPETFDNRREPRSDLYSLASTLHQTVTGRPPFWRSGEDSLNPLMRRLLNEPAPRIGAELVPPALADVVARSLAKQPDQRPADLRAFAAELTAIRSSTSSGITFHPPRPAAPAGFDPNAAAAAAAAPHWFGPDSLTVSADAPAQVGGRPPGTGAVASLDTPAGYRAPAVAHESAAAAGSGTSRVLLFSVIGGLVAIALFGALAVALNNNGGGEDPTTVAAGTDGETSPSVDDGTTTTQEISEATTSAPDVAVPVFEGEAGGLLAEVQSRGVLNCGVNDSFPGFGYQNADGSYSGLDIDFCRVVAAAVLGDAEAINFVPLAAAERFTALQGGDIDLLSRNTSQTASRTAEEGAEFPFTTFVDGQGFMVPASLGAESFDDLDGADVCVLIGTTSELNLFEVAEARGLTISTLSFEGNDEISSAYEAGQCDAWTWDVTALASFRSLLAAPEDHVILGEIITIEPLGPAVLTGDPEWATAVRWASMLPVQAWEAGIDSSNVGSYTGTNATARLITGQAPSEASFGLQPDYPRLIIEQVGNYEEIYNRNLGDSGLTLSGSANDLVANGGQMLAVPLR